MKSLTINNKEYKIKFGYNSFCDTDLMDRTSALIKIFKFNAVDSDSDVSTIGKIKELFEVVRELVFVGFKKYNPVDSLEEVGNLLDDYHDGEGENLGLIGIFTLITEELMTEGFFGELMHQLTTAMEATEKKSKKK